MASRTAKPSSSPRGGLVIVESPAKAKTISRFLGSDFVVQASIGHVRDLPTSTSDLPEEVRGSPYARLGVDLDHDFEPIYVVPPEKRDQIKTLRRLLKDADALWLATDEDREGEAIAWHLLTVLAPAKGVPVRRLVFHEITAEAIRDALEHPREIDEDLVHAQETRRILDRLYGYEVSPVLWRKIRRGLSAGRVQSVALRLLVDREKDRLAFRASEYWDLAGVFAPVEGDHARRTFEAVLAEVGGQRVASGRDFDPATGRLTEAAQKPPGVVRLGEAEARALADRLRGTRAEVAEVEESPYTQRPAAPFTTSTLQQEAGRKLRYTARRTMRLAQSLYENGVITYMRTDSTSLSAQAIGAARTLIQREYGDAYLPPAPRTYKNPVKNAQEAHEAIRPAGSAFISPADVRRAHGDEAGRLYEMIWQRTVASQMPDARGKRVTVKIRAGEALFRVSGKTIEFPGYQRAYVEDLDEPDEEREAAVPPLVKGQPLDVRGAEARQHVTQPPARYTEASLVKELDQRGIGRPSTWATIIEVLLERDYAFKKGTALVPTFTAFAVVRMLQQNFGDLLDYQFTARMEDDLDAISRGERDGREYLRAFWNGNGGPGLQQLVEAGKDTIDPRRTCTFVMGEIDGREIEVRVGKYGLFVTDGVSNASIPAETVPDELSLDKVRELLEAKARGPTPIGHDPESGKPVYVKAGRFGPYVQLGDPEGDEKPKMSSLLKGMDPLTLDLETALRLLSLPRDLGPHPKDGQSVLALTGRYGPFVKWGSESRSIPDTVSVLDITLEQAAALLEMPRTRPGRRAPAAPLRELGPHPDTGATLKVMAGRYGPYVTDGSINASLPKGMEPEELTAVEAVDLLRKRAERMGAKGGRKGGRGRGGAKKAAPKGAPEKAATKRAAAKKPAAQRKGAPRKAAGTAKKRKAASGRTRATAKPTTDAGGAGGADTASDEA
jgi:DNA topoisomerase-1